MRTTRCAIAYIVYVFFLIDQRVFHRGRLHDRLLLFYYVKLYLLERGGDPCGQLICFDKTVVIQVHFINQFPQCRRRLFRCVMRKFILLLR